MTGPTRLPAITAAAERIKARTFTVDGEAVVVGPDGLSRFDEVRRRKAAQTEILYAFDRIEHDGEDVRNLQRGLGKKPPTPSVKVRMAGRPFGSQLLRILNRLPRVVATPLILFPVCS